MMKTHQPLILIIACGTVQAGVRENRVQSFNYRGGGNSLQNRSYTERGLRHLPRFFNPDQSNKNIVEKPVDFK